MRLLTTMALLGSSLSILGAQAQTQNKEDPYDEFGPGLRRAKAEPRRTEAQDKNQPDSKDAVKTPAPSAALPTPAPPPVNVPTVEPAPPLEFPTKDVSPQEVSKIQVGAAEKDVLLALGTPSSRVAIPDDDGHLRETWQYWAKGVPVATLRLDNQRVIKVEIRSRPK